MGACFHAEVLQRLIGNGRREEETGERVAVAETACILVIAEKVEVLNVQAKFSLACLGQTVVLKVEQRVRLRGSE